jgi:hypothetical protein
MLPPDARGFELEQPTPGEAEREGQRSNPEAWGAVAQMLTDDG